MSGLSGIKEARLRALQQSYEKPELLNFSYLFCWDDVPGNNAELLNFVKDVVKADIEGASVKKEGSSVTVTAGASSVVLNLLADEGYVSVVPSQGEKSDYLVKEETGRLNVYSASFDSNADAQQSDMANGCGPGILM